MSGRRGVSSLYLCFCIYSISVSSLQLSEAGATFGMVKVTLPALGTDQQFWYLCVREAGSLKPALHQGALPWMALSTYTEMIPLWLKVTLFILVPLTSFK